MNRKNAINPQAVLPEGCVLQMPLNGKKTVNLIMSILIARDAENVSVYAQIKPSKWSKLKLSRGGITIEG